MISTKLYRVFLILFPAFVSLSTTLPIPAKDNSNASIDPIELAKTAAAIGSAAALGIGAIVATTAIISQAVDQSQEINSLQEQNSQLVNTVKEMRDNCGCGF